MIEDYEYKGISNKSRQFAIENLKEDPLQVNVHIENLRRWVKSMPHLTCPTDSKFLLQFLRVAKFDAKTAQQRLDNFCTIRYSTRGCPQYFDYGNINYSMIDEFLNAQILTPLGRNDDGELIALIAAKNWNPERIPKDKWTTLMFMGYDVMLSDEKTQIHGIKIFVDLSEASEKVARTWSNSNYIMQVQSIIQDGYPWRILREIFYSGHELFDDFFSMWSFYMNGNEDEIILRIKQDERHELDRISDLMNLLPAEYGGHGGPWSALSERWKQQFKTFYENGNPLADASVDESKRPEETLNYLMEYPEYYGQSFDCEDTENE